MSGRGLTWRLGAAALLFAVPQAAWADAFSAIALAAQWAVPAGYITAAAAAYIAIAVVVVGAANARRKARKVAAQQRAAYNAGLEARSVTVLAATPPLQVIYGRCILGGYIVAIFASDKTSTRPNGTSYTRPDALKHMVIVFAAHQCQAINEVYIEGVAVGTLDGNGQPTAGAFFATETAYREIALAAGGSSTQPYAVTVLSSNLANPADTTAPGPATYTVTGGGLTINNTSGVDSVVTFTMPVPKPVVRINKHLGTDTQTVSAYLNSVVPSQWTANHRLRGLCYAVVTLDLEDARFQGGPPNITADISGKLLFDTRTSSTAYSTNPALAVRDFLAAPWGYECTASDIDAAFCNAAANACDALISLDFGGGTVVTNQPTYTCNGAFTTEASRESVLEDLVEAMAGTASYGAKWQISAGAWAAPVMALTDNDLMGQIEVLQADAGMEEAFNGVRGVYIPASKSTPVEFDTYQNSTFLAADGLALWSDLTLPYTDNKPRARNLSRIFVERARNALVIRYPAKFKAWPLQAGDRVTVTSAEYGFATKNFRVTDWQFGITSPVVLTLQEDEAAAYDLADAATPDTAPNTNLPNPWAVATLSGVAAASGTAHLVKLADGTIDTRVRVSWTATSDAYVADGSGEVRIVWRRLVRDPVNVFQTVVVPGNATDAYISGVSAFDILSLQVFAVNGLGARGNPVVLVHQVVGKSAAPANVAGLAATTLAQGVRLSWGDNTEVDYESTELRHGASWAAGTRIFRGNASAYNWVNPAVGDYAVWAKHHDTSGNESTTASGVTAVVLFQGDINATSDLRLTQTRGGSADYRITSNAVASLPSTDAAFGDAVGSDEAYVGGAYCSFRLPAVGGTYAVVGLSTDPAGDPVTTQYGVIMRNTTAILARYLGSEISIGTYSAGMVCAIVYEGTRMRWYLNGVLAFTLAVAPGLKLYFAASTINASQSFVEAIKLGPLTGINIGNLPEQGQGGALNSDPGCSDMSAWVLGSGTPVVATLTDGVSGSTCIRTTGPTQFGSKFVPGSAGKVYRASAWMRKPSGTGVTYLRLYCYAADGTTELALVIGVEAVTTGSAWVRYQGSLVAPAGTAFVRLYIITNFPSGSGTTEIQDARLEEVINTDLLVDQSATVIGQTYVASVSIIKEAFTPDGFTRQTKAASVTLTPNPLTSANVDVIVTATGKYSLAASGGASGYGAASLHDATFSGWRNTDLGDSLTPSGTTTKGKFALSQKFSTAGNVSTEYALYSKRLNTTDTLTLTDIDFRVEIIKK